MEQLLEANKITTSEANAAKSEYSTFIASEAVLSKLQTFDVDSDHQDNLFVLLMKKNTNFYPVEDLTHSVGHVSWPSCRRKRFQYQKEVVVENMSQKSVVAQRLVHDTIMLVVGVLNIPIAFKLMDSVQAASRRLIFYIQSQRKEDESKKEARKKKLQVYNELQSIESESTKLLEKIKELDNARENKASKSSI